VLEPQSDALRGHLRGKSVISSAIAETELRRVALRAGGIDAIRVAERLIARVSSVPVSVSLLRRAGTLLPATLRSLDAIHLASALSLDPVVTEFVCYDSALAAAAAAAGLQPVSPS